MPLLEQSDPIGERLRLRGRADVYCNVRPRLRRSPRAFDVLRQSLTVSFLVRNQRNTVHCRANAAGRRPRREEAEGRPTLSGRSRQVKADTWALLARRSSANAFANASRNLATRAW